MGIAAGRLRDRVRIEIPDQQPNGQGGRRPTPGTSGWKELATVWAEVIPLRGDEAIRNNVERSVQLWRVTIRTRRDIQTAHRLVWPKHDIVMDIKSAAPDAQHADALVMTCESGVTGGTRR